ncbi:hypothetical protein SAMN05444166_7808 [Singulisphaera sp. GP187]|uniref:HD domain-containing protein n=1 Tax=Singulisphaera sp. GP187 TaxID=1882752 RepID=UPI0009265E0F|nr:HD domain-containing protein [Singulisphaera sp. GP187]SIO65725.1 hypothetical protein SAMN05444166_7808 [Singulisphaera sp. GP187]
MELTLELPSSLDAELDEDAKREGLSPAEQATLFLHLANALSSSEKTPTPFKAAVKGFLASRSLDPSLVASTFEELVRVCAAYHDLGKTSQAFQKGVGQETAMVTAPTDELLVTQVLMNWRNPFVHAPLREMVQRSGRTNRSCLGKYSYLPGSDEDFAREKIHEIAHEERPRG